MVSLTLSVLSAASAVLALTPPGFQPAAQSELVVEFQAVEANGQVLQRDGENLCLNSSEDSRAYRLI